MSTELNTSALTDDDQQTRRTLTRAKRILEQMLETKRTFSDRAEILPAAPEQTDVHKSCIMAGSRDSNTPTAVAQGLSLQTPQRSKLSEDDILKRGLLSVWDITISNHSDLIGSRCVLLRWHKSQVGYHVFRFHVPGKKRLYTLGPANLQTIQDDFPYDGDYCEKFHWLFRNPLNGVAYGTEFRYDSLIDDQFELQLLNRSADESVGAAEGIQQKKRTFDKTDVSAARPSKKKTRDYGFSKGDKVIVEATSGRNDRYNGKQGEVLSQLRVSQIMVAYYHVSLPEHNITICGNDLKLIERAPVAGGAPGAP